MGQLINSEIKHNSIDILRSQTSCILLQAHWDALDNIVIDNNWLNGAGYSLYTRNREYNFSNVSIINNRFGRDYKFGVWSSSDDLVPIELSGNVWDDTGEFVDGMN